MRHLIDPLDLTREETDRLMTLAESIIARPEEYAHKCDGRIVLRAKHPYPAEL